jgi:hypothetical protein
VHGIGIAVGGQVSVTVPPHIHRARRKGLRIYARELPEEEIVIVDGVPVTSAKRTLRDLLRDADDLTAVWACESALRSGAVSAPELDAVVAEMNGMPCCARVARRRKLVDARSESPAETAARLVIIDARLPPPEPQVEIRDADGQLIARVDLGYREIKLAIEIDGTALHAAPAAVYNDRWRQNSLIRQGWRILRFTW